MSIQETVKIHETMKAKKCPWCGEFALQERCGDENVQAQPNVAGPIVVRKVIWLHCESCGKDTLPSELDDADTTGRKPTTSESGGYSKDDIALLVLCVVTCVISCGPFLLCCFVLLKHLLLVRNLQGYFVVLFVSSLLPTLCGPLSAIACRRYLLPAVAILVVVCVGSLLLSISVLAAGFMDARGNGLFVNMFYVFVGTVIAFLEICLFALIACSSDRASLHCTSTN